MADEITPQKIEEELAPPEEAGNVKPEDFTSGDDAWELAEKCVLFCEAMGGLELYHYERSFAERIFYSLIVEDAEEITGCFARQSGKTETVAMCVVGAMVILPILANFPRGTFSPIIERTIVKFKNGIFIGVFGPSYEIGGILHKRMKVRLMSQAAREVMMDEDIGIDPDEISIRSMAMPNGSFCDLHSASPGTKIEGFTYHLIVLEESQDIGSSKIKKSISPMGAATAATLIKIGTPKAARCDFYEACRRNKQSDIQNQLKGTRAGLHHEHNDDVAAACNPRYALYIEKEKMRLGEQSDEYQMSYKLKWIIERGMFLNEEDLDIMAVPRYATLRTNIGKDIIRFIKTPSYVTIDKENEYVFGIDIGKSESDTVVTIMKPWWENPIKFGDDLRYYCHIVNWLLLIGDSHEVQYHKMMRFLSNYRLKGGCIDSTGKGDVVYDRIKVALKPFDVDVRPFIFSNVSKDRGYKLFKQEIDNGRISYPASAVCQKTKKYKLFRTQMELLTKNWKGNLMVVEKPGDLRGAKDDFPDSAMLANWYVNGAGRREVTVSKENKFYSRKERYRSRLNNM